MKGIYAGCPMRITHVFPRGAKRLSRIRKLSREATVRLRWFEHYHENRNASLTCRCFGILKKDFLQVEEKIQSRGSYHSGDQESCSQKEKKAFLRNVIKTTKVRSYSHVEPYYRIPEFRIMSGLAPRAGRCL